MSTRGVMRSETSLASIDEEAGDSSSGAPIINNEALRSFLRRHTYLYRTNVVATRLYNAGAVAAVAAVCSRGGWAGDAARLKAWLIVEAVVTCAHAGVHVAAMVNARREVSERTAAVRNVIGWVTVLVQVWWTVWVFIGVLFSIVYRGARSTAPAPYILTVVLSVCTMLLSQAYTFCMIGLMCTPGAREFRILSQESFSSVRRPASSSEILSLGVVPYSPSLFPDPEDATCPICLTEYEEGDELRILPCRDTADVKTGDCEGHECDERQGSDASASDAGDAGLGDDEGKEAEGGAVDRGDSKDDASVGKNDTRNSSMEAVTAGRTNSQASRGPLTSALSLSRMHSSKSRRLGHAFHAACIDAWLQRSRQCPVCKQDIVPSLRNSPSPLTNAIRQAVMTGSVSASQDMNSDLISTDGATVGTEPYAIASVGSSQPEPGHVVRGIDPPSPPVSTESHPQQTSTNSLSGSGIPAPSIQTKPGGA